MVDQKKLARDNQLLCTEYFMGLTLGEFLTPIFWQNVVKRRTGKCCWEWKHARKGAYGIFFISSGIYVGAHRFSLFLRDGVLPSIDTDHKCRNTRCVNWDHVEAVGVRENNIRCVHWRQFKQPHPRQQLG